MRRCRININKCFLANALIFCLVFLSTHLTYSNAEQYKNGTIEIVVTDAETKLPIEGVSIYIRNEEKMQFLTASTNKDGVAKFPAPEGKYATNSAYKIGYTNWVQNIPFAVSAGKTGRIEIQLSGPKKIIGIVKDTSGKPIAGIKVQLSPRFSSREPVSDANGVVEFPWLEQYLAMSEQIALFARDEKRNLAGMSELEEGKKTIDITMKPAVTVTGRVVDSKGKPITGSDVTIRCEGLLTSTEPNKTNKEGRFTIKALPKEINLQIYVTANDYGTATKAVDSSETEKTIYDAGLIKLVEANMSVSGVVVDGNDMPIAKIGIYSMAGEGQASRSTTTDKDGKFTLNKLCPGNVRLYVSPTESYNVINLMVEAGATDVRVVLRPRSTSRVILQQPASLVGRPLPDLKNIGVEINAADVNDKMILLCFFDKEQRPSRYMVTELAKQADELKQKGIITANVEASKIDDKTRFNWVIKSLPWLILTDRKNTIKAEGFALNELNDKIKEIGG
jgi:hypothetical protein